MGSILTENEHCGEPEVDDAPDGKGEASRRDPQRVLVRQSAHVQAESWNLEKVVRSGVYPATNSGC